MLSGGNTKGRCGGWTNKRASERAGEEAMRMFCHQLCNFVCFRSSRRLFPLCFLMTPLCPIYAHIILMTTLQIVHVEKVSSWSRCHSAVQTKTFSVPRNIAFPRGKNYPSLCSVHTALHLGSFDCSRGVIIVWAPVNQYLTHTSPGGQGVEKHFQGADWSRRVRLAWEHFS